MSDIKLIHGDCMEGLKQYPDKHFDIAIVDVPYGIGESFKNFGSRGKLANADKYISKDWDNNSPDKTYFNEIIRVSKHEIIFGANHFISKIPYDSSCWIVWDKNNGQNDFADCELAWTSFKTAVRKFKYTWNGMLQENMKVRENRIHPTQKPVRVLEQLIELFTDPNEVVIDPCFGSGTTLLAAAQTGRKSYGFEIKKGYFKDANEKVLSRIQTRLF